MGRLPLPRQHGARPRQIGGGDQQHHLGLLPHAEGVDRLGEAALQHDLDALALEQPAERPA